MIRREPFQQKESMARGWKELGVEPGAHEEEELCWALGRVEMDWVQLCWKVTWKI